jgi:hypothetical protein
MSLVKRICLITLLTITGCAAPTLRTIPTGNIATPGIRIDDAGGGFSLISGREFKTPFSTDCKYILLNDLDLNQEYRPLLFKTTLEEKYINIRDAYNNALAIGGHKVIVNRDGISTPLYGILIFCQVENFATGPASRSNLIQIPDQYINEASNGAVSVVYELVERANNNRDGYGWILWLSDKPF